MESKSGQYIKPAYKIFGRFVSECMAYLKSGKGIGMPIQDFPAYFSYNRRLIPPFLASKPWIVHRAFLELQKYLKPQMHVLEFGSGGSTLYLADKVASIYSIEHDEKWYHLIHKQLEAYPKITHVLVPPVKKEGKEEYKSVHGLFSEGLDFENYAHAADHLPEESFDLLIIDGRVRPQCLKNSISKLKRGGMLIFDNADRETYQDTIQTFLSGWKKKRFSGVTIYDPYFNSTHIYFKP